MIRRLQVQIESSHAHEEGGAGVSLGHQEWVRFDLIEAILDGFSLPVDRFTAPSGSLMGL
jgi:hypothetical protein